MIDFLAMACSLFAVVFGFIWWVWVDLMGAFTYDGGIAGCTG